MSRKVDDVTREWMRGPADEKAVAAGCRFDLSRAQFAFEWIERYCFLYEGVPPGTKMTLRDWQQEFIMRLFGWVRYSNEYGEWIRRFKKASVFIAKKNKKSPTLAAVGLYLLCGEGEQGQKVFSCAKDGKQAMISHRHAMEMIWRSPELSPPECGVNKSTGRITHEMSRSFFDVISGDNIEGQEGLNGCLLVDEVHVVDARLMKRLEYMGISRKEPLHIEVSTAGTDPDGYGKKQFDRSVAIQEGRIEDQETLAMVYAAPQDLTNDALDADPVKYGKMANPAWGHTIREEEFLSSYARSKKSISDLADFKMYRLNIWQRSSNPWLRASSWDKSGKPFKPSDMIGQTCVGALDLSRVSDFTAFARLFESPDNPEAVRLLVSLWLPRKYAEDNNHLVPFLEWARDGHIKLVDGDVMDYAIVEADIIAMHKETPIEKLAFDEMYAEELTQRIADETGCDRIAFKQDIRTFAKATDDFEALVIAELLHHNHNPALTWMAGHCEVYRDANGNKRPIKPDGRKGGLKKIDGIVAGIMTIPFRNLPASTPYDDGEIFSV